MEEKNLTDKTNINEIPLDELLDLRDLIQNQIIQAVTKDNLNELDQISSKYQYLLFMIQSTMEQAEHQLGELTNLIFELGVLNELLVLSSKLYTSKKLAKALSRPRTAYKDQILEILYENGPLLHKALAERLKITPSNLSNVIRRLNNEEVILIEETLIGKYKYYALSRAGRDYIKEKAKQEIPFIVQISPNPLLKPKELVQVSLQSSNYWIQRNYNFEKQIKNHQKKQLPQTYLQEKSSYNEFARDLSSRYRQCLKSPSFTSALVSTYKITIKGKEKSPQAV